MLKYSEVIKVVYFDPIEIETPDEVFSLTFKAEVLKTSNDSYRIQLYEREYYTVQPAFFPEHATEAAWIESNFPIECETIAEASPERALEVLIERLQNTLKTALEDKK